MKPPMKKKLALLVVFFFFMGCAPVKKVVTDVKEGVQGIFRKEKEDTKKSPQEQDKADAETTQDNTEDSPPPPRTRPKATSPSKKGSSRTTPIPTGEVFGPR
jgi:hypothetical protein